MYCNDCNPRNRNCEFRIRGKTLVAHDRLVASLHDAGVGAGVDVLNNPNPNAPPNNPTINNSFSIIFVLRKQESELCTSTRIKQDANETPQQRVQIQSTKQHEHTLSKMSSSHLNMLTISNREAISHILHHSSIAHHLTSHQHSTSQADDLAKPSQHAQQQSCIASKTNQQKTHLDSMIDIGSKSAHEAKDARFAS